MYKIISFNILNTKTTLYINNEEDAVRMFNDFILINSQNIEIATELIKKQKYEDVEMVCKYMYLEKDGKMLSDIEFNLSHELYEFFL